MFRGSDKPYFLLWTQGTGKDNVHMTETHTHRDIFSCGHKPFPAEHLEHKTTHFTILDASGSVKFHQISKG